MLSASTPVHTVMVKLGGCCHCHGRRVLAAMSAESSLGATSSGGGPCVVGPPCSIHDARRPTYAQTWLIASRTWQRTAGTQRRAVALAVADKATQSLGKWYDSASSLRQHSGLTRLERMGREGFRKGHTRSGCPRAPVCAAVDAQGPGILCASTKTNPWTSASSV